MTDQTNIISILRTCSAFEGLPDSALSVMVEVSQDVTLEPGEVLLRQGEASTEVYVITHGEVEVTQETKSGDELRLGRVTPVSLVGEMQTLTGGVRMATVRATTEARLLCIEREVLDQVVQEHPALLVRLAKPARERLRQDQLRAALHERIDDDTIDLDKVLDDLMTSVEWVSLKRGDSLFREGEPSDSLYFLLQGRLQAVLVNSAGDMTRLDEFLPGECFGETAVLPGEKHEASVIATRPSEVAKITRESFLTLAERNSALFMFIIEELARIKVRASPVQSTTGKTVALVPLSRNVPMRLVIAQLTKVSSDICRAVVINREKIEQRFGDPRVADGGVASVASLGLPVWLEQLEASHDVVFLQADRLDRGWTRRCVSTADEVVLIGMAESNPQPDRSEKALLWASARELRSDTTLVLLHRQNEPPRNTQAWLEERHIDRVLHIQRHLERDYQRLARYVTGRAVGAVISGGAARAFAGIGVLRALIEVGVPIDAVGGVSAGAIVSALYGKSPNPDQLMYWLGRLMTSIIPDPTLPVVSLLRGKTIIKGFEKLFAGAFIEDLLIPCLFVSSNMTRAELYISRRGPIHEHLYASNALPPVMAPHVMDGDLLCDGALINNIPIAEVRKLVRGGPVVAVDVTPTIEFEDNEPTPMGISGWKVVVDRLRRSGARSKMPNVLELLFRSQILHHYALLREVEQRADLYLRPDLSEFSLSDHLRYRAIAEAGFDATVGPIRQWWESLGEG